MDAATNAADVEQFQKRKAEVEAKGETIPKEEEVRYQIPFPAVLENFLGQSIIDDVYSPALGAKTQAKQSARLKTFPTYLMISLSKYQVGRVFSKTQIQYKY